jgi:hypothetical protein
MLTRRVEARSRIRSRKDASTLGERSEGPGIRPGPRDKRAGRLSRLLNPVLIKLEEAYRAAIDGEATRHETHGLFGRIVPAS